MMEAKKEKPHYNNSQQKQHCNHPYFIRNRCIECGKSRSFQPSTLPFSYIQPNVTLTSPKIHRLRDENLRSLLSRKKLHLLLDLDHTLIHSTAASNKESASIAAMDDTFQILNGKYTVKLRPGVRKFLDQVSSMFDLSVYTMSGRVYATEIVKLLNNGRSSKFVWVICKEDCLKEKQKTLDVVLSHEKVVLIVDDLAKVWQESGSENLVKIRPYYFFPDKAEKTKEMDTELYRVLSILMKVHNAFYNYNFEGRGKVKYSKRDVRKVLQRILLNNSVRGERQNLLYNSLRKIILATIDFTRILRK